MGKYFGTDGFRGEANIVLTVEHAFKVGRYLGWYFGREKKARIVIGKDTRRSSYMFEYALASGLTASGADAYLLHVTTTKIKKGICSFIYTKTLNKKASKKNPNIIPKSTKVIGNLFADIFTSNSVGIINFIITSSLSFLSIFYLLIVLFLLL